ncbi:cysteine desulfurase [candidate division KSB1 bacterium]|nr:cysteine desulfurase [candidate division KSB1 bacterium]
MDPIYLDYNATTPIAAEVAEAMVPFLKEFGNPSSTHVFGRRAKAAVNNARDQIAALLNCEPHEVYFTSGGSESNNWALKGATALQNEAHILTSQIEHPAILKVCQYLLKQGVSTTYLPVQQNGVIDVGQYARVLEEQKISLVSIMHANNEVGTVQPVKEIASLARSEGILIHTDAAQSVGKIPVNVQELGVDLLSVAGHKLYAPKGIGAFFCREGVKLENLIHGAGHERGRRAGTENILLIVALGKACELAQDRIAIQQTQVRQLRDRLQNMLLTNIANTRINGAEAERLPNTLSISIQGVQSHEILHQIEDKLACSAGSACHAGEVSISPVLQAMKVPADFAAGTLRLSLGISTTEEEIESAARIIVEAVSKLRN